MTYNAGLSSYNVSTIHAAVNKKLTGLLTPHSLLTAVRDMAAPVVIAPKRPTLHQPMFIITQTSRVCTVDHVVDTEKHELLALIDVVVATEAKSLAYNRNLSEPAGVDERTEISYQLRDAQLHMR